MDLKELLPAAKDADSIDDLEEITSHMWQIIHDAKKEIAAYRPGHDKDGDGAADEGELKDKRDRNRGDGDESDEGTKGDADDEGTDEEDPGVEEEAIILAGLNAMELEVDNYQIAILNTMHPESGIGIPEGITASESGHALLDAIAAARTLTGDELALAWADIMNQRAAYIQLVMEYDRVWGIGLFGNEVVPV